MEPTKEIYKSYLDKSCDVQDYLKNLCYVIAFSHVIHGACG